MQGTVIDPLCKHVVCLQGTLSWMEQIERPREYSQLKRMFEDSQKMDSVCFRSTVRGRDRGGDLGWPLKERQKGWRVGRGGCNPSPGVQISLFVGGTVNRLV